MLHCYQNTQTQNVAVCFKDKNNPGSYFPSCRCFLLSLMFVWDHSSLKHHTKIVFFVF